MPVVALGIDCDFDVSVHTPLLVQHKISFVGQYLRSWLTLASVGRLHTAKIKLLTYWETTATAALQGGGKGAADGGAALKKMLALGAPPDAAVCMTVDTDVGEAQIETVEDYFAAADGLLWKHFRIMGYADGTAISELRKHGLPLCVLAGAMGWEGSHDFLNTQTPNIVQGPPITKGGMTWPRTPWPTHGVQPIQWPDLGFDYDPLIALTPDFGVW
jgi:hypothetical protein